MILNSSFSSFKKIQSFCFYYFPHVYPNPFHFLQWNAKRKGFKIMYTLQLCTTEAYSDHQLSHSNNDKNIENDTEHSGMSAQ